MPTYNQVFDMIAQGFGPHTIMETLKLPPSKFLRVVRSARMQAYLRAQKEMALDITRLELSRRIMEIPENLTQAARQPKTGWRACRELMEQYNRIVLPELQTKPRPAESGKGRRKAAKAGRKRQKLAQSGRSRQNTADYGRLGQARTGRKSRNKNG